MHVGKAAALIVVAVILGAIVLRDNGTGTVSAGDIRDRLDEVTQTTVANEGEVTPTTVAATLHDKSTVKVVAINASGTAGVAGKATSKLQAAGYNALQPGDATASVRSSRPASVVYVVTPGYELDAQEIAALFGLPDSAVRSGLPSPSPSGDIQPDAHIVVLVGSGITL